LEKAFQEANAPFGGMADPFATPAGSTFAPDQYSVQNCSPQYSSENTQTKQKCDAYRSCKEVLKLVGHAWASSFELTKMKKTGSFL
jgi:hypothetical protein